MKDRLIAWGPAAAWAGVLFFLSSVPGSAYPTHLFPGADKAAHLVMYGVLGAALGWGRRKSPESAPRPGVLWALGVLYGASDEGHQAFVPGRDVSLGDLTADAVGVAVGYWLFTRIVGRRAAKAASPPSI